MPYKKMLLIYDREGRRYFAGWEGEFPIWSDEIDLARVQSDQKEADNNYEMLRALGYDVKVQG
jgi:hypothetical protein